jgi:hypothetical protein
LCSVSVDIDEDYKRKFLNFLLWKYCFYDKCGVEWTRNIFFEYGKSQEIFPLPMEYSYGAYILKSMREKQSEQETHQLELNF